MPFSWGCAQRNSQPTIWISTDFDFTTEPKEAKPFMRHAYVMTFIGSHLSDEAHLWYPKPLPSPPAQDAA